MSSSRLFFSFTFCVLLLLPAAAQATIINFTANMDCAQAAAGAGTCAAGGSGTGTANITLDDSNGLLSWNIVYAGLSAPETAMHFHGPALPNMDAGVVVNVGVGGSPVIGSTNISGAQANELFNGLWYLNLHSSAFPSGEIRGQVLLPEPTTFALFGAALVAAGFLGRPNRRTALGDATA